MLHGKKVVVVLPAYRAARTLEQTYREIPKEVVDATILVDDASSDDTAELARRLGILTYVHPLNRGYGGNQKTCYTLALGLKADIVVMLHPDYQYDPRLITAMAAMVASEVYDVVLGSRILGNTARAGGMPLYKYVANRFLTAVQNVLMGTKLSEFHTGYRAFSRRDNQILAQTVAAGFSIGEISCPTRYFPEASSISFGRSVRYGFGVLSTSLRFRSWKWGILRPRILDGSPELRLPRGAQEPAPQP